jgi:hypothetical protein
MSWMRNNPGPSPAYESLLVNISTRLCAVILLAATSAGAPARGSTMLEQARVTGLVVFANRVLVAGTGGSREEQERLLLVRETAVWLSQSPGEDKNITVRYRDRERDTRGWPDTADDTYRGGRAGGCQRVGVRAEPVCDVREYPCNRRDSWSPCITTSSAVPGKPSPRTQHVRERCSRP